MPRIAVTSPQRPKLGVALSRPVAGHEHPALGSAPRTPSPTRRMPLGTIPFLQRALGNRSFGRAVAEGPNQRRATPLPPRLRRQAGSLWSADLSDVRVHTSQEAAAAARALGTPAFTLGSDIAIDAARVRPGTFYYAHVLLHEAAHAAQQRSARVAPTLKIAPRRGPTERDAAAATGRALLGRRTGLGGGSHFEIACFDDGLHRVIEMLALAGVFPEAAIEQIYQGNLERDYSQLPAPVNLVLINQLSAFGGYSPAEHFDNYQYDPVAGGWFTRDDPFRRVLRTAGPVGYIHTQLQASFDAEPGPGRYRQLGNALHTVEDFFAHSNFVELTLIGPEGSTALLTGSFTGADPLISFLRKLHAATGNSWYRERADAAAAKGPPTSHSLIAKDSADHPLFRHAALLAIGLVRQTGSSMLAAYQLKPTDPSDAQSGVDRVKEVLTRRLAPPDWSDRWWERFAPGADPELEGNLDRMVDRLDPTVNQTIFSPFRALRASSEEALVHPLIGAFWSRELGGGARVAGGLGLNLMIDPEIPTNPQRLRTVTPFLGPVVLIRFE